MKSQNYLPKIKTLLESGAILTNRSILFQIGTTEGRKYIADLRNKHGMSIADKTVERNGKSFKEYWLDKKVA